MKQEIQLKFSEKSTGKFLALRFKVERLCRTETFALDASRSVSTSRQRRRVCYVTQRDAGSAAGDGLDGDANIARGALSGEFELGPPYPPVCKTHLCPNTEYQSRVHLVHGYITFFSWDLIPGNQGQSRRTTCTRVNTVRKTQTIRRKPSTNDALASDTGPSARLLRISPTLHVAGSSCAQRTRRPRPVPTSSSVRTSGTRQAQT